MTQTIRIMLLTCLVAAIAGTARSQPMPQLLKDARVDGFKISRDAYVLKSFMRQPKLDWRSHASEIDHMKNDINAAARTAEKLSDARADAATWQIKIVDRIIPLLRQIADNTTSAIEALNRNQSRLLITGDYKDFIESNADLSKQLADLVGHYVDYGSSKNKFDDVEKTLTLRRR